MPNVETVIARVRFTRRWQNYFPNDVAVFPLGAAQNLVASRYAEALPPPIAAVGPEDTPPSPVPQRQPSSTVRK